MRQDAHHSLRHRVAAVLASEALVWAVVLACLLTLAAASGALSD
ncbi:hypothetical protein [Cellulomonas sp. URHE0023]|nr:hypothetical protein [Cellulomonas sp. URHE0023]